MPGLVEQEGDVPVRGHPGLVEHQDVAFGQPHPLVFEPPAQGGQGPGVGKAGLPTEGPGRLAGGRGANHGEAGRFEGVADGGHDRGLARSGHTLDQLHPPARGGDPHHRRLLAGGQWRPQDSALAGDGIGCHLGCHPGRPQVLHTSFHSLLDGQFGGNDMGGGKGLLGGPRHTDQGDGVGITEDPLGGLLQLDGQGGRRPMGPRPR